MHLLEKVSRSLSSLNGKRMGLRYTPQSTGPRFNPCDVDIVVAILDDCRHRWIGGHNVFEVVFIRKYYNLIEPRRGKTHRCSHCPHPFLSVRFIGLRLWYAGIALCFPIFGIFLPIYCAILFFERNILTFVAQSVKIVVKGQLALALTFMESRYGDG